MFNLLKRKNEMKIEGTEIEINGVKYVKEGSQSSAIAVKDGLTYAVIRGDRSGVFAGYYDADEYDGEKSIILYNTRRLWYWDGAASISQLAEHGTSKPTNCKFTVPVQKMRVTDVIEVLDATEKAKKSIEGVKIWEA